MAKRPLNCTHASVMFLIMLATASMVSGCQRAPNNSTYDDHERPSPQLDDTQAVLSGDTIDLPAGKKVSVLYGDKAEKLGEIHSTGTITDVVWDSRQNTILALRPHDNLWLIEKHDLSSGSSKGLLFPEKFLPGSRIFFYKGAPCIMAGKKGDPKPELLVIGDRLESDRQITIEVDDWDAALDSVTADVRREVLHEASPWMPRIPYDIEKNITGSLAPITDEWKRFPVIIGHPSKPIVLFDQEVKAFAVADVSVQIYKLLNDRWTQFEFEHGDFYLGGTCVSGMFNQDNLIVSFWKREGNTYVTATLNLKTSEEKSPVYRETLFATPRHLREPDQRSSKRSND